MKNIFRKIFYILLAVCLLGGGAYALTLSPQSETTFAENTTPQEISNNNLPDYFGVNETDGGGLISSNIFAYSSGASLSLSLKTNGTFNAGTNSVYEYVYYPDKEIHPDNPNIFHFYFYQVSALSLTINGETRNLDQQQFVTKSSEHFTNYFAADLHAFEIKFDETGYDSNAIKLLDGENNLIEGIYTLNLQIVLFECTDGTTDASETQFENERLVDISYSFYVVNKSDYLTNNMPNVTRNAFDTEIEATTSSVFDYYLYSNYSSEDTTNSIPYIEYDYERYELSINKTISVSTYTQSLLYDIDTQSVVTTGDNVVALTQNAQNHTARVYFYNVGNYVVTYNDILLQEIDGELEKHKLTGLSNQTKKYQIYVYGYQANYTDMDAAPDSNNIRPVAELKTLDFEAGTFSQSADITSAFLKSNVAYSQATYNTSILISNVAEYINDNTITPIQTNQTPIKFTENARLSTDSSITSYIYTTNNLAGYAPTEYTLGEQTLYRKRFTGQAEGATGTYIYIITYTFDDFRTSSATTAPNKYFRQIFFFEINKELPTIKIETESGKNIRNFVNEDVLIYDTTKTATPYNKNVQIRIFARDFNNNFLASFGGTQGINYNDLLANENGEFITLSQSAFYTIRLYFENEIKGTTISFYNDTKKIREVPFTIDKMEIENIRGTNVSEILDSTDYSVVSTIEGLSTNQNFVLSWNRKASGASTTAYYRYFKIDAFQYHTSDANFQSAVLEHMLSLENSMLPINNTLDMSTENNSWNIYAGNADTQIERGRVSAEYVFTDGGLYLVDIFDEAGNHAYDIFLLDYTTPIFAIYNTSSGNYSIPNSAEFVADDSVLYWSKYKGLIFTNFEDFYTGYTKEGQYSVSDNLLQERNLYKNHDGEYVREIYNTFFDKIKTAGFLTHINCSTTPKEDTALYNKSYTGAYLTISISSTYWRLNENNKYEKVVNQYQESIDSSKELNYRIIIRDESNTKLVPNIADNTAVQHYTQHPSASQRIAVSFDTSNFAIFYTENGEREYLFSNNTAEQEIEGKTYKTTYLNPKSKETAFYLAFTPTQEKEGENITIQVSDVTINYYAYITESETIDGVVYNYMTLSENPVAIPMYEFDENSSVKETEEKDVPIKINIDGYTAAGKYVITRRYQTGDGFTYNGKDFYSRTFVFYVDRNDVITNPDLVTNGSTSHLESLVGGDIFIAMYDNGETSDLVVTFPDSYNGNSKSSSLYNSGIPRTVLTTNKLPVSIYIPQYKYTKSVQKVLDSTNEYHFEVTPNEEMNTYYSSSVITEYLLYATLEKANFSESGVETSRSLIARTSNSATPTSSSIFTDGHGFLRFYSASNNTPFYSLEESGRYYVTIYQGYLIGEDVQSLTFTFDIQKSDPDFEATSTSGTELGKIGNNYYTNQSTISLVWDASTSEYIADIDPDAIVFETNNSIKYIKASGAIWDEIWVQRPTLSNNSYISQISLEKLGVYSNGASVKVTMQYKNHSRYYQKVTKTIHVDLSAPSTTINNLISKSVEGSNISGLNASSLRTFYTAGMQETTGQDVSYNISNNSGTFAFYSYSVNENFINTLKTSPDYYRTYVKKFEGTKYQTGELQETSPADFLPSNYTEVSKASLTLAAGNYYEVVETDLAQNLTIYTIYVTNYSDNTEALISYKNAANEEFAYTIGDYKEVLSHSGANHNIYARTGFRLQDINYFGDEWAQFTLKKLDGANSSVTYYLMMSPWDKTHAFSIVNGELISFELSSLINGSINGQRKNVLTFKNRITGDTESFYINTRNVDLDARLTNVQEREYISFASPTNEQINSTTTACVYLTELKIMANDTPYYYNKTNRLGYASDWVSNENVSVSLNAGNFITFELSPSLGLTPNTKITYTYKTNYGIEYTEIHLYREKIISREVSSPNDIYAYRAANGTLIYVTKDKFEYHFNRDKYKVFIYDVINGERSVEQTTNATIGKSDLSDGETIYSLIQNVDEGGTPYYDNTYVLEIWDRNEVNDDGTAIAEEYHPVKYVYVTLYDKLPRKNKSTTAANEAGYFKLLDASRNNITERITESLSTDEAGYFSEITLMYAEDDTFIPVKYMISTDKVDWEEVASGTIFKNDSDQMQKYYLRIWYDTTYLANEYGSAAYVFGYIDQNQIYEFNLSSLTSTFWIEKTIDGITTVLQKNGTIYRAPNGKQYSNHYVVNLSYASRDAVVIKTNREQDIVATNVGADNNGTPIADSDLVFSDIWLISNAHNTTIPNLPKFTTYVVITYIPTSENFVGEFRTYDENGIISETEELLSMDKKQFIVTQDYSTISRVELQWTKYNGIEYNEINIAITKDGVALKPTIFTRKIEKDGETHSYNYCYLTNSGKYIISLYDNAGNIQKFKYGVAGQTDKFTFIFLKDVPFNVTYTNPNTGEQETSFPIKQAVYNGSVSLEIDKSTQSEFYSNDGYPSLTIYRNGVLIHSDDYVTKEENGKRKFIFSRPGFYEYHFTAKSKELDTTIRQESYQFTIINANEYRYSYIFNKYSNYYIEKVVKNGKDITNRLLKTLNNETITIGQNQYLVELPLSYLDEKTGAGVYLITINSNNKFLQNSNIPSSWTYQVVIQVGSAPISISVAEGQGVTKAVSVTYNASNIYQEMGECTIQVMKHINGQLYAVYRQSIDESSSGVQSTKIDRSEYGSYFVQIVSPSGTLLYSYKVNKKEPMNAASILAIVGSVILFVVIVIIVYRLRKKIAVK